MAEVILMDFLSAGTADFPIIFVNNRKALRTRLRCWLYIIQRDQVSQLDPLFTREFFGARCQRSTNFAGDIFPVADIGREQVPQLFPPLRKSVLHNLAKKFVIGNPDLPFVAWCEANNRRGDLGLEQKPSAEFFGDTRRGDEVAVAR